MPDDVDANVDMLTDEKICESLQVVNDKIATICDILDLIIHASPRADEYTLITAHSRLMNIANLIDIRMRESIDCVDDARAPKYSNDKYCTNAEVDIENPVTIGARDASASSDSEDGARDMIIKFKPKSRGNNRRKFSAKAKLCDILCAPDELFKRRSGECASRECANLDSDARREDDPEEPEPVPAPAPPFPFPPNNPAPVPAKMQAEMDKDAFRAQINNCSARWTAKEKNAMQKIIDDEFNLGDGGIETRFWRARGSKITFLAETLTNGDILISRWHDGCDILC